VGVKRVICYDHNKKQKKIKYFKVGIKIMIYIKYVGERISFGWYIYPDQIPQDANQAVCKAYKFLTKLDKIVMRRAKETEKFCENLYKNILEEELVKHDMKIVED